MARGPHARRPGVQRGRRTAGLMGLLGIVIALAVGAWLDPAAESGAVPPAAASVPASQAPRPGTPAASGPTPTHRLAGRVVRVMDGDTVRLQPGSGNARTIRLASIDAPETGGQDRPGQPHGQASRRELMRLVEGATLSAVCYDVDPHGRDVCDLILSSGESANRAMVQAGLAWANRERGGQFLRDPAVAELEAQARRARRGLWQDTQPMAPWQWRYTCWREGRCNGS